MSYSLVYGSLKQYGDNWYRDSWYQPDYKKAIDSL